MRWVGTVEKLGSEARQRRQARHDYSLIIC